jgi:hypothetical protein
MKSSKKGIRRQALRGSSLSRRRFSTSFTSLTRPTSSSSLSNSTSRSASSCAITSAILRYFHAPLCASASSLSGHQHVTHERTEHRQLTATSAPSMLRESRYARLLRTCNPLFSIYYYIHVCTLCTHHTLAMHRLVHSMYISCIYINSFYTLCMKHVYTCYIHVYAMYIFV